MTLESDTALIEDFFNHIIWDILNNILFEVNNSVSLADLRDDIKRLFMKRLNYEIPNEDFEARVKRVIKDHGVDPALSTFFLNLLWQFMGKLNFYFSEYEDASSATQELREVVYEYLLLSYFENIILQPVIKLLFINKQVHYGTIFGFKVKCKELFKAALDSSLTINEMKEAFHEEIRALGVPDLVVQSIEAVIFSFFESVASVGSMDEYIQIVKRILDQKKPLLRLEESSLLEGKSHMDVLLQWFNRESLEVFMRSLQELDVPFTFTPAEIHAKIQDAFRQLVQGNLTFDTYARRIQESLVVDDETVDLPYVSLPWKFKSLTPATPPDPVVMFYTQTVTMVLSLGEFIWHERQRDPTLQEFIHFCRQQNQNQRDMFI